MGVSRRRTLLTADDARRLLETSFLMLDNLESWCYSHSTSIAVLPTGGAGRSRRTSQPTECQALRIISLRSSCSRALRALDSLPRQLREVLVLRYRHGYSYRSLARILHVSLSTAHALEGRAIDAFRRAYETHQLLT